MVSLYGGKLLQHRSAGCKAMLKRNYSLLATSYVSPKQ